MVGLEGDIERMMGEGGGLAFDFSTSNVDA